MDTIVTMTGCQWGVVLGASLAAAVCDLRTRRIPNWLSLPVAGAALAYGAWSRGLAGFGEAALAWVVVAMPFIILFLLGRGGAGDAKMIGAIGAWLGLKEGLIVLSSVCIVGAILALLRIVVHAERWTVFCSLMTSLYVHLIALAGGRPGWRLLKMEPQEEAREYSQQITIPYGVAIFLGVCLGAVVVQLWIQ
jgi:Flp pilus assembly protein protease CpaA